MMHSIAFLHLPSLSQMRCFRFPTVFVFRTPHAFCARSISFLQGWSAPGAIAILSRYTHGGVFGGEHCSLCPIRSKWRGTFSSSNFTSMDQQIKLASPLIVLVTTPFFGALPASSPVLVLK